jgi:hypothetical protein
MSTTKLLSLKSVAAVLPPVYIVIKFFHDVYVLLFGR